MKVKSVSNCSYVTVEIEEREIYDILAEAARDYLERVNYTNSKLTFLKASMDELGTHTVIFIYRGEKE